MAGVAHNDELIQAAYRSLDAAISSLDYQAYLDQLGAEHEIIHPDERRVTRKDLEHAAFPFDGVRRCQMTHTVLRFQFVRPPGCTVVAESTAQVVLGNRSFQEDRLIQDLWTPEGQEWKLRRRIVLRERRKAPGFFSLVEHPLYCQFGHVRTEKTTWKESSR